MHNKKSVELSMNFIVILIISIIMFGFGVRFIYNLSSKAKDITQLTFEELDQRISGIICEGYQRVCVGIDRKTIQRTKFDFLGLKIINILDDQEFTVSISPPSDKLGVKNDNSEISTSEAHLLINPASRNFLIKKNEERVLGIGVQVPANAVSGTYILNVEIKTFINGKVENYVNVQKLYVEVP